MDFSKIALLNESLQGPMGSVIGAFLILLAGWLVAKIIAALTQKSLARTGLNEKLGSSLGTKLSLDVLLAKAIFWFILIIALSAALNQLNLTAISTPFANMINQVLSFLPNAVAALIVGAIGWMVATLARNAVAITITKTQLDAKLSQDADIKPISSNIADIVYWFILLIVLTMVVGRLGLTGLFTPLTNMVDKIFDFMPNAIIAGFVVFVGFVVAKIVRSLVTNVVIGLNLQKLMEQTSFGQKNNLPEIAGSLSFLLVMVPFTITALDALKVEAISRPATNMLNKIMEALPNVFTATAVLVVTYFVVRMLAGIVKRLLESTQINELPSKIGIQGVLGSKQVSDVVAGAILFFAMLFATIAAADLLGFDQISDIVTMFIAFGSQIILGAVILTIGFWLANLIAGAVQRSEQGSKFLANIVRVLIMGLVLAMGLKAMGIADSIVNLAFGLTLGAVAVAFALSFGLGGQEAAARYLRRLQDRLENQDQE